MSGVGISTFTVLVCLVAASGQVSAQGRGLPAQEQRDKVKEVSGSPAARAAKLAELDSWLRRLVGRFAYSGYITNGGEDSLCDVARRYNPQLVCSNSLSASPRPIQGIGSCVSIGAGPGVRCLINVEWPRGLGSVPWESNLAPATILYGIDPVALGIRYLQVDGQSLAEGTLGYLQNDTASFTVSCANTPKLSCSRVVKIYAPPNENSIELSVTVVLRIGRIIYHMHLQRMPQIQEDAASNRPPR
jgi:hypothetical protein